MGLVVTALAEDGVNAIKGFSESIKAKYRGLCLPGMARGICRASSSLRVK